MGSISGMLALALLGAEPAAPTAGEPIACQARVMSVDGLDWRRACNVQLTAVKRTPTTAVWVADRSVQAALLKKAGDRVSPALALDSRDEVAAAATSCRAIEYVQAHQWKHTSLGANVELASEIMTRRGTVEEKFEVRTSAKRLDQGTLARVWLADSHVARMHKAPVAPEGGDDLAIGSEGVGAAGPLEGVGEAVDAAAEALLPAYRFLKLVGTAFDAADAASHDPIPLGKVEVPEVVAATAEGEWLVPDDSVLIVSLGVHTGADAQGKAIARERLAILDFGAKVGPSASPAMGLFPADDTARACEASGPAPTPIALSHLNMPAVPARSLPEAIDKDGRVVDLPPLPEAYAAADLNRITAGSPLASSQTPPARPSRPAADPQLARTSLEAPAAAPATEEVIGVDFEFGFAEGGTPHQGRLTRYVSGKAVPQPAQLAALVEDFLRRGMGTRAGACPAEPAMGADACPACPAAEPAHRDPADVRTTFAAALQNPGTTETQFIPLGKGLSLEVRVRVVPEPKGVDDQARAFNPGRVRELVVESDKLRQAGDEWGRFWFHDQPAQMTPLPTAGDAQP